jgi:hypothetical protein
VWGLRRSNWCCVAAPEGARLPAEAIERIQRERLAYRVRLCTAHIVTNGPVTEQPDPSLRFLMFYRTGSLEQAR